MVHYLQLKFYVYNFYVITGKQMSELTDEAIQGCQLRDLYINGDTLIALKRKSPTVLFYKLNMWLSNIQFGKNDTASS